MRKAKNGINKGFIQGVVVNTYSPNDKFLSLTLRVRENKVQEDTGKKDYYYIRFSAYGDMAKDIKENISNNQVVYLEYYMTQTRRRDNNGVLEVFDNRPITFIQLGDYLVYPNRTKVPYYNRGLISGEFVNIKYLPKSETEAAMTIRVINETADGRTTSHYANLIVKGDLIAEIEERCVQGQTTCVEFKTVTANRNGGRKEAEYVATSLIM